MTLRQYDANEFDFHIEDTTFNCLSNGVRSCYEGKKNMQLKLGLPPPGK